MIHYFRLAATGTTSSLATKAMTAFRANEGNDLILASAGTDTLDGGDGDDTLDGGADNDSALWRHGAMTTLDRRHPANDEMYGGDDRDTFCAGGDGYGNDTIVGGRGRRRLGPDRRHPAVSADTNVTFTDDEAGTICQRQRMARGEKGPFPRVRGDPHRIGRRHGRCLGHRKRHRGRDRGRRRQHHRPGAGDDTINPAGAGADTVAAGAGDDLIELGDDGDVDTIVFSDGDGADRLSGFDAPIDNGDGHLIGNPGGEPALT